MRSSSLIEFNVIDDLMSTRGINDMIARTSQLSKANTTPSRPPVAVQGNPETDAIAARQVLINIVTGTIIGDTVFGTASTGSPCMQTTTMRYVDDFVERMSPRDPAEELLVSQMLLTHARVIRLNHLAQQATGLEQVRIVNEYADRASNTYRRLMMAFREYRRPPRQGDSFTAIQQANIAHQQVVMNREHNAQENTTNEQGCEPGAGSTSLPAES